MTPPHSATGTGVSRAKGGRVTRCTRKGCAGTIEEDGFCSDCGLRPGRAAPSAPARQPNGSAASPAAAARAPQLIVPVPGSRRGAEAGERAGAGAAARSSRPSASSSAGRRLGAGMVEIPPAPVADPAMAVLEDAQVAESKRVCSQCQQPVGRGRDGKAGRAEGFCPRDGTPYSFSPKLQRGEILDGKYEVVGCIGYGGQGWVYLAVDHSLDERWVVLKGLVNAADPAAQAAALAERRFLSGVKHPGIVSVYSFVQHQDQLTGAMAGYIVMEYVGGQSLRQIVLERREAGESLPVAHALAYALEVLPALGYLHGKGLVYCDFKPDNAIVSEDRLKLIDMGAVRRIDDTGGYVYSTDGYRAPEIVPDGPGPSPSSDLYSLGRTLAVLTFRFSFTTSYLHSLPDPADVLVLAEHESFYRLLLRATHPDPLRRFTSAEQMAEQLTGVLREVLSTADGRQRPAFSTLFTPEQRAIGAASAAGTHEGASLTAADAAAGLPVPLADAADPAAGYLTTLTTLAGLDAVDQAAELAAVTADPPGTPPGVAGSAEVRLALARARISTGDLDAAAADLQALVDSDRADWRVTWYQGLRQLAAGEPDRACASFDAVYGVLPGELAPRLAVALAAEAAGDHAAAARHFQVLWTLDHSYVSGAFGLARTRLAAGDRAGAIEVLGSVPENSSHHGPAQIAAFRARISGRNHADLTLPELTAAGEQLRRLRLDGASRASLTADLLLTALGWVAAGKAPSGARLLDTDLSERSLRFGLEEAYRSLARLAPDRGHRIRLVDMANDVRPRTRF
jgi:serine/threonine-protein kinase PknG